MIAVIYVLLEAILWCAYFGVTDRPWHYLILILIGIVSGALAEVIIQNTSDAAA